MNELEHALHDPDATAESVDEGARPFDGRAPCIMMVDDEPVIIEVLRLYLGDAGYRQFVTTTDSTVAVELAGQSRPDLLLLDLKMPVVNGFEVLEAVRGNPRTRHLPVIVLTSATDAASRLRALELGATDFLAKPVDASELALRVKNILAVKAYQDRLAFHDHVTGLANRRRFLDGLDRALAHGRASGTPCAVLQVGMDRFKQLNDALGYSAGDVALRELGTRIRDLLERRAPGGSVDSVLVARTGGDEFMAVLSDAGVAGEAERLAAEVCARVAEPIIHVHEAPIITASVGIAVSPAHGADVDTLLARAGQALSFAKKRGGDACEVYSDEIDSWARERLDLERDLRSASADGALHLAYQPQVAVSDGRLLGAEALLRWQHPTRGPVSPAEFIPLAEETGLIVPIGEWVLREACREASDWGRLGHGPLRLSVNVSARQFEDPVLCQVVAAALADSGLDAELLALEVTESMLMTDPAAAARSLEALKALGVQLSIDDFGTGYSSLAYLKRFNVDELKIDRSFVREIPDEQDDAAIVTAVLAMAVSLGLGTVAEGVETPAQLDFLASARCDHFQGFLFSRPVAGTEFAALAASLSQTTSARELCVAR